MVVKGDLTEHGRSHEWRALAPLLQAVPVPLAICPGNHDVRSSRRRSPQEELGSDGLACADPVDVVDLPGIRVVTVDSTNPEHSPGTLRHSLPDLLDALAEADRPALVCLHHPFEPLPVPTQYPVGIAWPESRHALAAIRRAKKDVLISTGHTHRNRRLRFGPLVQAEVAAVKDYPGVWAGYAVHEGGIRQVVRRITSPAAMGWTEYTRLTFAAVWKPYAPGLRRHRSFVWRWPG
jgi:3',5'-cyclic AMP phosphodiesterase CpdA